MSRNGVQPGGEAAAPARRTLSRDSWIRLARKTLETRGVANVKVDRLARKLNVTRGSFYFHFKGLKDLLSALLQEWRTRNCAPFQALAVQDALPGIDLFEEIVATWVREDPFSPALDMAIRDWGRASRPVRKEVQAIDALRIGLLERSFRMMGYEADESLIRARITYFHQIGYYALALEEPRHERLRYVPIYDRILTGRREDAGPAGALAGMNRPGRAGQGRVPR